ncbi:tetratricopeptide repeat-containing sensor histidine kinase [Pedobacter sp. UBA5917]|jgi:signal transduction histidine kinase|uniref:tetratricopeptide repeat-containing sensor histidine kinase n=1 Tax=Pedobacter sp. UBA5917 TaxID=1947061 RepID=UPI0025E0FE12|nr:tetratricopeptide repeat protein [Pedobacter sp. UBA5917]
MNTCALFKMGATFLLFLFFGITVSAQINAPQKKLDSLLTVNQKNQKTDSTKIKILTEVYRQYMRMKNVDKAEEYLDKTIQLSHEKNLKKFSAMAYYRRALMYHGRSNYQKAEENYLIAVTEFSSIGNLDMEAGTYLNLGALYGNIPDYIKSLEVNQKAISIYEKMGNETDMASCYTNISSIYQRLGNQSQALVYLKMALKVFAKEGENARGVAVVYGLIGNNYFEASDSELMQMNVLPGQKIKLALEYYNKSLKVAEAIKDVGIIATTKRDLADLYSSIGQKDAALKSYQKSIELSKNGDDKEAYASTLYALGNFYQRENDFENAISLLGSSLKIAEENRFLETEKDASLGLSTVYEKQKDYNKSLAYYRQYIKVRDQIFNEDKEKEITRRQMQLDFNVKERDYLLKQKLTEGELKRQQQELTLKRQQLALTAKEKALDLLTFQKAKADLDIQRLAQEGKFARAKYQAQLAASIKDKQISRQDQQIKFDGRIKIFLSIATVLILIIAVVIFLNQRKTTRLNKIINNQKRELEQLSKVKDRIFSVVSHDMRTPVNSLISFMQLLEGGNIEQEKLNRYAASLKNNLTYTSTMMENLLNWAASQMQGFNPYLENLDIEHLTTEVIHSLQDNADQKQINLQNLISSGTFCKADENMLSLVIRNLISNAIKFTPVGGAIEINAASLANRLEIKISDTGVGLTEVQLNHFNKPGYLGAGVSTLGTNKEKGTGLGLLLCRTFIGLMAGEIKASTNPGGGSCFTITLSK